MEEEVVVDGEQAELAAEKNKGAEYDVIEQILRSLRAGLSCLMDLRRGHRFRERQLGILHHDAPYQRNEQEAEHQADQHQRGRFPIGRGGMEDGQAFTIRTRAA